MAQTDSIQDVQNWKPSLVKNGLTTRIGDQATQAYERVTTFDAHNAYIKMLAGGDSIKEAQYTLNANEVTAIEGQILHVLRWALKSPRFMTTKNMGGGILKHTYDKWNDVPAPRPSISFDGGRVVTVSKTETSVNLIGYDYDTYLTMPQIDAMNNSNRLQKFEESLQQGTITELTRSLAQYREWAIFRGTSAPGVDDLGITGLVNASGITTPTAYGLDADNNLTAAGDVLDAAQKAANGLIAARYDPPFVLLMTPLVMAQANKNKDTTTYKSDMAKIKELQGGEGTGAMFSDIIMCPYLINSATETTSTGALYAVKPDPTHFRVIESYGLGYYPLPPTGLGVRGKLLWMGVTEVRRPTAVSGRGSQTTN